MKQILAIAWKDTLIRFSRRSELLFFLVLPVVFSLVISLSTKSMGDSRIPLLVVDQDGGALAKELVTALDQSKTVRVLAVSAEEADSQFRERKAAAILTVPPGLDNAQRAGVAVQLGFVEATGNADAIAARQAVQAALGAVGRVLEVADESVLAAEARKPFASAADRGAYWEQSKRRAEELFTQQSTWVIVTSPRSTAQSASAYSSTAQGSAGQLVTWVFIDLLGISALYVRERQLGTLRRLVSAPVSRTQALMGTVVGQMATAMVQMILLAGFGALALGLEWWRDPWATLSIFLAFGLAAVAFGTMLGSLVRTEGQAGALTTALGMTMALLGGCWYPRELFPTAVQQMMLALPTSWAMIGMNDILLRGQGIAGIAGSLVALLGFAVLFFAVGIWRYRYE
jgi:ABC-2 type transport system permease protein